MEGKLYHMCLSLVHPSSMWMYVQPPPPHPLARSWLLQRQKKRITPILRPYHLYSQTSTGRHIYCSEYRGPMFVLSDICLVSFSTITALLQNIWQCHNCWLFRGHCSLTYDQEQVNTILHGLLSIISVDYEPRVFPLKGLWNVFFCANHKMWRWKMVEISVLKNK